MGAWYVLGVVLLLSVKVLSISRSNIPKVTQDNLEERLKEKRCMFLYATTDKCKACSLLYNKFVTVSQTFTDDPDIFFGQFSDQAFADAFGLKTFPGVVFYEYGSAVPKTYLGDLTTGALTKVVTKAMKGDFRSLEVRYAVQLTKANFDDVIGNDKQYRLVMLHEDDDEDEIDTFDELAETFDKDFEIAFARINVDVEKYLNNQYIAESYPSFYWYEKGNLEQKKRYDGELGVDQMISFINQHTGFQRMKEGRLTPFAGLIKPIDDILHKHGTRLYKVRNIYRTKSDVKAVIKKLPKDTDNELTDYYLHLLDELEEGGSVETLGESRSRLYSELEGTGPLDRDQIFRKRNIVQKFIDIIGKQIMAELSNSDVENIQDYITTGDDSEHGILFHEDL